MSRELIYTAVTRAKQELYIICEPDRGEIYNSLTRAAKSPEIPGVTLQEKAEYFRAKKNEKTRTKRSAKDLLTEAERVTDVEDKESQDVD